VSARSQELKGLVVEPLTGLSVEIASLTAEEGVVGKDVAVPTQDKIQS